MAIVKLLRDGQLTLPAEVLQALKLAEGTLLHTEVRNGAVLLRPLDRETAKRRIRELVERAWQATESLSDEEWECIVAKAIAAAKREEQIALIPSIGTNSTCRRRPCSRRTP
jgi:bifunctional DNA-binding transcriptional regulator/antitoxin component of YhaV-PrlF toxin-antitoxin module